MPSTFIKDFKMVKSKSEPKTEEISPVSDPAPRPASGYKKFLVRLILWIIFLAVMLGLWLNPEIIYNSAQYLKNQTAPQTEGAVTFNNLQTQVAELRNKVMNLGAALPEVPENCAGRHQSHEPWCRPAQFSGTSG